MKGIMKTLGPRDLWFKFVVSKCKVGYLVGTLSVAKESHEYSGRRRNEIKTFQRNILQCVRQSWWGILLSYTLLKHPFLFFTHFISRPRILFSATFFWPTCPLQGTPLPKNYPSLMLGIAQIGWVPCAQIVVALFCFRDSNPWKIFFWQEIGM